MGTGAADGKTAFVVAYDGAPFAGYQVQPDRQTVQGVLEQALETVLGRRVATTCAGRTDAGVHAEGQVVAFDATGTEPGLPDLRRSLNALCAPHVAVRDVRRARPDFDPRHDALSRTYRYRLSTGQVPPLALSARSWWVRTELDVEAMRAGARRLVGEHDFASFCVAESARGVRTVRHVHAIGLERERALGEECLSLVVTGRSFLHSMVRVIVGTLVEVGKGRHPEGWVAEVLAGRDRSDAGPTAPPHGLVLESVEYPEDVWS
jgi:tRNA pseudouridine38-40 synthase